MTPNRENAGICRCPTCRAEQRWSDECRRCGTDLSSLRRLAGESAKLRRAFLAALEAKDDFLAEFLIMRLTEISPTPLNESLLGFVKNRRKNA